MTPMSETTHSEPRTTRRPFALVALAGLMLIKAALILFAMIGVRVLNADSIGQVLDPSTGELIRNDQIATGVLIAIAALLALSAVGVLARHRAGWLLAMVLTGVFIAADIFTFLNGNATYVWMFLNIVTVFYLNQPDARSSVGIGQRDAHPPAAA